MPPLFIMTELTGSRSNDERKIIFSGYEFDFRHFWIAIIAAIPGALLTAMFWPLLDTYAVLLLLLVEVAAFFLIERRARDGMELRTWQAIRDKKKAAVGHFYVCGAPVSMTEESFITFRSSTVPLTKADDEQRLLNSLGDYRFNLRQRTNPAPIAPQPAR
jgi:hypothetical protein